MTQIFNSSSIAAELPNTYLLANKTIFFANTNKNYFDFYNRILRHSREWVDGYVPAFHKQEEGIFSSRMGSVLCSGIAKQITGSNISFKLGKTYTADKIETAKKNLAQMSDWAKESNFKSAMKKGILFEVQEGTSFLKINIDDDEKPWLEAVRLSDALFSINSKGIISDISFFIRTFSTTKNDGKSVNYAMVEHRFFEEEEKEFELDGQKRLIKTGKKIPKVSYEIHEYTGLAYTQTDKVDDKKCDIAYGKGLEWKALPKNVQQSIQESYNGIFIDKPITMPFRYGYLGVEALRFDEDPTQTNSPFGRIWIYDIITDLIGLDLTYSYLFRDMFNGKGVVGLPKSLTQSDLVGNMPTQVSTTENGVLSATPPIPTKVDMVSAASNPFSGANSSNIAGYEIIPGLDPESQKPIINQFNLRIDEWEKAINLFLRNISTKIGMSPKVIASYLAQQLQLKTASESNSEDDSVVEWINNQRDNISDPINALLNQVAHCMAIENDVQIKFATTPFVSKEKQLDYAIKLRDAGLIDNEEAIRMVFPDDDEAIIQYKVEKAKEQQAINDAKSAIFPPNDQSGGAF